MKRTLLKRYRNITFSCLTAPVLLLAICVHLEIYLRVDVAVGTEVRNHQVLFCSSFLIHCREGELDIQTVLCAN